MSDTPAVLRPRLGGTPHPHTGLITRMRSGLPLAPQRLESHRVIHPDAADARCIDLFRELRTRLLQASPVANPVILVSGVRAGCGSSFVARNLAAAIAMDEDRTALLVDCNLRRPSAGDVFDVEGAGLDDYLRDHDIGIESILHPAGVPRLRVIPAGRASLHGGDRLASLRMRAMLDELHGRYADRCLVLDAPPARGTPEARLLAERAHLVVLVAGEGMHTEEHLRQAAQAFDPARLAGIVFNRLP